MARARVIVAMTLGVTEGTCVDGKFGLIRADPNITHISVSNITSYEVT